MEELFWTSLEPFETPRSQGLSKAVDAGQQSKVCSNAPVIRHENGHQTETLHVASDFKRHA